MVETQEDRVVTQSEGDSSVANPLSPSLADWQVPSPNQHDPSALGSGQMVGVRPGFLLNVESRWRRLYVFTAVVIPLSMMAPPLAFLDTCRINISSPKPASTTITSTQDA